MPVIIYSLTIFNGETTMNEEAKAQFDDFLTDSIHFKKLRLKIETFGKNIKFHRTKQSTTQLMFEKLTLKLINILNRFAEHRDDKVHEHTLGTRWLSSKMS
ncbi:hypothetical protein H17ap60334_10674 [Thermosipho africanus H17ap60334]|uniref:hypothetical protein n=1 Tax=Thermosipho africanus TaxID=2421 RepID=UPI00028F02D1|nr:hypothetical protein [Thermosipho africanus]EKF48598.1 hypothetical protein H17ap60334_10674 [Thermosipho africanus H17ap60334]